MEDVRYEHRGETIDLLETLQNIRKAVERVDGYLPWMLPLMSHHAVDEQIRQYYGQG